MKLVYRKLFYRFGQYYLTLQYVPVLHKLFIISIDSNLNVIQCVLLKNQQINKRDKKPQR